MKGEQIMNNWVSLNDMLPKEGVTVETKVSDTNGERNIQKLIRKSNLWFLPDMTMYVYYIPTHWRYCK